MYNNSQLGIFLNQVQNSSFKKNSLDHNYIGFESYNSRHNEIYLNDIYWNDYCGLFLSQSNNNKIQGNDDDDSDEESQNNEIKMSFKFFFLICAAIISSILYSRKFS